MSNKNYRLQLIKELINGERIESQENLAERLKDKGLSLTQATLSRDLKLLNAAKISDEGGYRYVIGERVQSKDAISAYLSGKIPEKENK